MPRLALIFTDETGASRRVDVDRPKFVVGRHAECDLAIGDNRLSRRHAQIETLGAVFVTTDLGSSNGTTLNGAALTGPAALKDGDSLSFGGFPVRIEIQADEVRQRRAPATATATASAAAPESSIPTAVFIIAPVLALLFLVCGGGALWFTAGPDKRETRNDPTPEETTFETPDPSPRVSPSATFGSPTPSGSASPGATVTSPQTPVPGGPDKDVENAVATFLQKIAENDPTAFLRSSELSLVTPKLNALKGSAAVAENIKAAGAAKQQFRDLVANTGLRPEFVAAAALTQLGATRGNPLETAKSMMPALEGLRGPLGNSLADDCLLMIAAFDQGKAGKFKDLRNQLEALAKKNPSVGPREIRTIWFLKKQGKISDAEFDFALRFIAVGAISQNPKAFGVNAETLTF